MTEERKPLLWTLARVQEWLNERELQDAFTECILLANEIVTEYERTLYALGQRVLDENARANEAEAALAAPTPQTVEMPAGIHELLYRLLEGEIEAIEEYHYNEIQKDILVAQVKAAMEWLEQRPGAEVEG